MKNPDLPLYKFFNILRINGFPIGLSEYHTFIEALKLGFGINFDNKNLDKERTLKLCKTLWLKPDQSNFVFENLFRENFENFEFFKPGENQPLPEVIEEPNPAEQEIKDGQTSDQTIPTESKITTPDKNIIKKDDPKPVIKNDPMDEDFPLVKFVLGSANQDNFQLSNRKVEKTRKFFFAENYFDISKRQMQQASRFLPSTVATLNSDEIDIEASIHHIAKNGFLLKPILKRKERIINDVLLLIDYGGSMVAFENLSRLIQATLKDTFKTSKEANKRKVSSYYFYNIPQQYCYKNTNLTEYEPLSNIVEKLNAHTSSIIIFSDAGAARGGNSDNRFKASLKFLFHLKRATDKIVWLNPLPENRWEKTTAKRISRFIPMFSLASQHDLKNAVDILRGK